MQATVLYANGTTQSRNLHFNTCVAIGYAGRDQVSVRKHVDELALLGVPAPASIPSMYWITPLQLTNADHIQVVGGETSAEVEFFMAPGEDGKYYFTVASDHSDRKLESVSVSKAKQICPKVLGDVFWALDDVRDHWDRLQLDCRVTLPEDAPYQNAAVGSLLGWDTLLELARKDAPAVGPVAYCSGTVPVIGGQLRFAEGWEIRITDPVLRRSICKHYTVACLPDRN